MWFCRFLYVGLLLVGLGMSFAKHGEAKTGRYNGWTSLIAVAIDILILWGAGFFS